MTNRSAPRLVRVYSFALALLLFGHDAVHAQRLPSPTARKSAIKCQAALLKASAKFFGVELAVLAKCNGKALDCVLQTKPESRAKCLAKGNSCRTTLQGVLAKADNDLGASITDSCSGVPSEDLLGLDGLGFDGVEQECLSVGSDLFDIRSISSCLRKVFPRSIERLFAVESPRTRELFRVTGIDVNALPDLPGYPNCNGCPVSADPPAAKALMKCSKKIAGAGRSFATMAAGLVSKCALALFECEQSPKDLSVAELGLCRAKAQVKCEKAKGKAAEAQEKVRQQVEASCADVPNNVLTAQDGANIGTLACECTAVEIDQVQSLDDYLACSRLHHECRVAQLLRFAIPRLDGLLLHTDNTKKLEDILCALPPDVQSSTRALPGCRICRFMSAIRARFNKVGGFGSIVKYAVLKQGGAKLLTRGTSSGRRDARAPLATITEISGDRTYAPNRAGQITVGYQLTGAATTLPRSDPPELLIAVERLDGSLVANDAFALSLEPGIDQTDLTVAYSPAVPGESGCSFRLVFGIANGDGTEFPFDLAAGACQPNGRVDTGEDCDPLDPHGPSNCDVNCTIARCGNGVVSGGELCDDGNLDAGDACPPDCGLATPTPTRTATPTPTVTPGRFVDNGDGTVTDNQTGLQWEKKTSTPGSGINLADPHDVDNEYKWCVDADVNDACDNLQGPTGPADGPVFTEFLAALNTAPCFAGHCDWRIPKVNRDGGSLELETIVDPTVPGCGTPSTPCIATIFGPTIAYSYWSSTTLAQYPNGAWNLSFQSGTLDNDLKYKVGYVRAVRP